MLPCLSAMWNDYDPDGEPVFFVGASATTSNGLALGLQPTQILVPPNSVADNFSYTIADDQGVKTNATVSIAIITNVTCQAIGLDVSVPGQVWVSFTGVPWYSYQCERATNATFTGTVQSWPVQAWADGSIYWWDNFTDLGGAPRQAFYRLRLAP